MTETEHLQEIIISLQEEIQDLRADRADLLAENRQLRWELARMDLSDDCWGRP